MKPEIEVMHSKRLWGRGRLKQLLRRLRCGVVGHDYFPWHFDWPYDCPEAWEEEAMRDPRDDEILLWIRGCHKSCGRIEAARVSLKDAGYLPGSITGLYNNPIRQNYVR